MLLDLYKLINKSSTRTPLEDFTTECFAGILQQHPLVLDSFTNWLGLPKGTYRVSTQSKHYLKDDMNCIIDLVLESNEVLCFIENKVNSKEGWEQLNRYTKVLNKELKKTTFLKYCTKFVDSKKSDNHNFSQFRWYELAKLLKTKHSDNPLVIDYLKFLKVHQMTQDTSITTDTVITMNRFLQTYEAINLHIENALPLFSQCFSGKIVKENSIKEIKEFDRISRSINGILKDTSKHSEILYCIHFETVKLQTQIWISGSHLQVELLYEKIKDNKEFKFWRDNGNLGIFLECKLYQFINSENSDQDIKDWFKNSFLSFRELIQTTPEIEWNEKLVN